MAKKLGGLLGNSYRRLWRVGFVIVMVLAKRLVRFTVIGVFVFGLLWLLYANVWRSLQQEVSLPLGVTSDPPRVDVEALRSINAARAVRDEWVGRDFSTWSGVFAEPLNQSVSGAGDQ